MANQPDEFEEEDTGEDTKNGIGNIGALLDELIEKRAIQLLQKKLDKCFEVYWDDNNEASIYLENKIRVAINEAWEKGNYKDKIVEKTLVLLKAVDNIKPEIRIDFDRVYLK
jgi:hypothetical protein